MGLIDSKIAPNADFLSSGVSIARKSGRELVLVLDFGALAYLSSPSSLIYLLAGFVFHTGSFFYSSNEFLAGETYPDYIYLKAFMKASVDY